MNNFVLAVSRSNSNLWEAVALLECLLCDRLAGWRDRPGREMTNYCQSGALHGFSTKHCSRHKRENPGNIEWNRDVQISRNTGDQSLVTGSAFLYFLAILQTRKTIQGVRRYN